MIYQALNLVRPQYTQYTKIFYSLWCNLCREIAAEYFGTEKIKAVDIERGIFTLVRNNQTELAARLLNQAEA